MKDKKKIIIADDHMVVTEGIARALEKERGFEIAGTAVDGLQAIEMVKTLKPDIVIMDISMPKLTGVEATREIKRIDAAIDIVVFSMYSAREYIVSLFRAGVSAYVLKGEPISDLILALKAVGRGGTFYSKAVQTILKEHLQESASGGAALENRLLDLSTREKEIFILLADGLKPREIAERLCISPKTVETHKYNIMEKLDIRSVAQMTKLALKKDLIRI